jgi:predicted MFS family arabinose efflux permease
MKAVENVKSFSKYHWTVFSICWLGGIFAGMNAHMFSLLMPEAITELTHTTDRVTISKLGANILSLFLVGWMFGGIVFGILCDRFGRKISMMISVIILATFTACAGLVQNTWQLGVCRFFTGLGIGGEMLCISIFLSETWPGKSRSLALGALITSYQVGVFGSAYVTYLIPEWRVAFGMTGYQVVLAVVIYNYLQESTQWIKSKKVVRTSQDKRNLIIGSIAFGSLLIGYWASSFWVPTWIQDIVQGTPRGEKNYATMVHALCAIGGCMSSGLFVNYFGRIPVIFTTFAAAFAVSLWMFGSNAYFTTHIYWQYGVLGWCLGLLQGAFYIYLPELFHTSIRASSVGLCLNLGRIVTAIGVLFVGVLVPFLGGYGHALIVFACMYLVGIACCLIATETK